jgi:hypothetical protein
MRIAATILSAIVVLAGTTAQAATLRVPAEYPTIQAGVDAAVAGDTVLVAAVSRSPWKSGGAAPVRTLRCYLS